MSRELGTRYHRRVPATGEMILYDVRDGVAELTLNRPDSLNAWTREMGAEMLDALGRAEADPAVRALVLTGAGRAFSAGADVKGERELTPEGEADLHTSLEVAYNLVVLELRRLPKPVLASINGPCAGVGASIALSCDLVIAADSAYFLLAFINLGLSPDGGVVPHLAAHIGPARTARLMMLGERLPATTALDWGLINEVHPDEQLPAATRELADRLAAAPTVAVATGKQLLAACPPADLAAHLAFEAQAQQRHASTADYIEGVAAFKEKRKPRFIGR